MVRQIGAVLSIILFTWPLPLAVGQVSQLGVVPQGSFNVMLMPLDDEYGGVNSPALFGAQPVPALGTLRADIGFDYLYPIFSDRSVSLVVPTEDGAATGELSNFSNDFAFVPRFTVEYVFPNLGFGIGASAKVFQISGGSFQSVETTEQLDATQDTSATVEMALANVIEGTKSLYLGELCHFEGTCMEDTFVVATLGGRYGYVHQFFRSTLTLGDTGSKSTLVSEQTFTGFGITGSLSWLSPIIGELAWYGSTRGSFLIGDNDRSSNLDVIVVGGTSSGTKLKEIRTDFVPSIEWETGFAYGLAFARAQTSPPPTTAPLLWLRFGFVGQLWGNVGLLNILDENNKFSDKGLLLLGFTLQVGLDY